MLFYAVYPLFCFLSHSIRRCPHAIYISPVSCANAPLSVLALSPEVERRCRAVRGAVLLRERTRDGRRPVGESSFLRKKESAEQGALFRFCLAGAAGGRTKSRLQKRTEKIPGEHIDQMRIVDYFIKVILGLIVRRSSMNLSLSFGDISIGNTLFNIFRSENLIDTRCLDNAAVLKKLVTFFISAILSIGNHCHL